MLACGPCVWIVPFFSWEHLSQRLQSLLHPSLAKQRLIVLQDGIMSTLMGLNGAVYSARLASSGSGCVCAFDCHFMMLYLWTALVQETVENLGALLCTAKLRCLLSITCMNPNNNTEALCKILTRHEEYMWYSYMILHFEALLLPWGEGLEWAQANF